MEPKTENLHRINKDNYVDTDAEDVSGEFLHDSELIFDARRASPIAEYHEEGSRLSQELIGVLMLGGSSVGIVRISKDNKAKIALSLIDDKKSSEHNWSLLRNPTLEPGVPIVIGRDDLNGSDSTISRKHLYVLIDDEGKLRVVDQSGNGTTFLRHEKRQTEEDVVYRGIRKYLSRKKITNSNEVSVRDIIEDPGSWKFTGIIPGLLLEDDSKGQNDGAIFDYTYIPKAENTTATSKSYEEYHAGGGVDQPEKYQGRPTIHRDSPINGGVYIVPGSQEAIVVDDGTMSKNGNPPSYVEAAYKKAMDSFVATAKAKNINVLMGVKNNLVDKLLEASLESAMKTIKYDSGVGDYALNAFRDKKINLSEFLLEGAGVCRHQALLVGYLLEKLIKGGYLGGSISVDRNRIPGKGGHAWARYVAQDGTVYIIDPAQEYVGTLKDSLLNSNWVYSRPEDRF